MTDRVLRWGLLSTADINRALIPPLRTSPRNELVAIASRSGARAEEYARQWGIPRAHGSYEALLADREVDVVYISLPNSLHMQWTVAAARAGKHVLCEKPLGLTTAEVDAMEAAAREAGVVVAEAFMYRHHPQTLKAKELVAKGAVGTVRLVRGAFTYNMAPGENIRLVPELGGGSVWDVGCYPISYARYLVGAEPVEAFGWQHAGPSGVDEVFAGQLRFPGDVYAQFDCGFRATLRMELEVIGDGGKLSLPNAFKPADQSVVLLEHEDGSESVEIEGQALYLGEIEDLADAILLGKAPLVSLADSRDNVATINALLESARAGQPVSVA